MLPGGIFLYLLPPSHRPRPLTKPDQPMRLLTPFLIFATAAMLLQSCSSDTVTGLPPIASEHDIQANIDGTLETQQEAESDTGITAMTLETWEGFGSGSGYRVHHTTSFARTIFVSIDTTYRSLEIGFIYTFAEQPETEEQYDSLVRKGAMSFGSVDKGIDGVEISWTDRAGTIWRSSAGTGDQMGSSFFVTEHERTVREIDRPVPARYNTKGTFHCWLYDGKGNSIAVYNGRFSIWTIITL